jgi:hypothetical protein
MFNSITLFFLNYFQTTIARQSALTQIKIVGNRNREALKNQGKNV